MKDEEEPASQMVILLHFTDQQVLDSTQSRRKNNQATKFTLICHDTDNAAETIRNKMCSNIFVVRL